MKRDPITPRPDMAARHQALEYVGASRADGSPYWVEDACFTLTEGEIETLYGAAKACEGLVRNALIDAFASPESLAELGLNARLQTLAQISWRRGDPSVYGRFDFAWDGVSPPKLLEYNADTPTALYEASVVQWQWLTDRDPDGDQFNSIHEALIEAWKPLAGAIRRASGTLHLASMMDDVDDAATTAYMADVASQAGIACRLMDIEDIGLDGRRLVDRDGRAISHLFKLYPWEWLTSENEAYADALLETDIGVMEPAWRVAASSKALLARLWRASPEHPNLLAASLREADIGGDRIGKPLLGREGANLHLRFSDQSLTTEGPFADQPLVWQARAAMPAFDGRIPVFGVWVVAGEPVGLGVREDTAAVTGPGACFIPHRIGAG